MKTLRLSCLAGSIALQANAHVILTKPASRNFLASRDGGNTQWPWADCPHCLNGGGVGVVQQRQEELTGLSTWQGYPESLAVSQRHSICGGTFAGDDRFDDDGTFSPLSDAYDGPNKGTWGSASPFAQGGEISLDVEVHAHHQGHFEFFLCNKDEQLPGADTTVECLNQHRLLRAPDLDNEVSPTDPNHPERYYVPPPCALREVGPSGRPLVENMRFVLPSGVSCERCVLQLVYVGGNSCNSNGYHEYSWPDISETCPGSNDGEERWWSENLVNCLDRSYPEEFWNCADIKIALPDGDTLPPIAAPSLPPATLSPTVMEGEGGGSNDTPAPTVFTCQDSPTFFANNGRARDCEWVINGGRCGTYGDECPLSCGFCSPRRGPLVIVGLVSGAGASRPVTFRFYDATEGLLFSASLGSLPDNIAYEKIFPDAIASGSAAEEALLDGVAVGFGELCVQQESSGTPRDLVVARAETYVWIGDFEYVAGCASPYSNLRVEPGSCERFPMLPVIYDAETGEHTPVPTPANPSPTSPSPPPPTPSTTEEPTPAPTADNPSPTSPSPPPPTSSPTWDTNLPANPQCSGLPCDNMNLCRSKWGYCGDTSAYCNDESTWLPSCVGSVPQPTPQPAPTTSPQSPSSPPSSSQPPTPSPDGPADRAAIGQLVRNALHSRAAAFTNDVLLYQTPSNQWEPSTVYQFDDMLVALENMWTTGIGARQLYLGDDVDVGQERRKQYAIVNIAAFLAQSMQETIQYNACDENSWDLVAGKYPLSNACGQLGQSYQDYQCPAGEEHMACEVDPEQELVATTHATWYGAPAPLFCGPKSTYPFTGFWDHSAQCNKPWADPPEECAVYDGQKAGAFDNSVPHANANGRTDVEGCCFWGRGVIQTTGVCNFGKLNYYIGARADSEGRDALYPDINFCKRPDMICDENSGHPELKWIAGLFYWMESVQGYDEGGWNYLENLREFVDAGMPNAGSDVGFINSVSGIVNRGCHNPPCPAGALHAGSERAQNFMKVLQAAQLI